MKKDFGASKPLRLRRAKSRLTEWLNKQKNANKKISVTGRSLGGALAQMTATDRTAAGNSLNKVITYKYGGGRGKIYRAIQSREYFDD